MIQAEIGSFVVVPSLLPTVKSVDRIIGTIENVSISSQTDFAYVEVFFFNHRKRWFKETELFSTDEEKLISLIGMEKNPAMIKLAKMIKGGELKPIELYKQEEIFHPELGKVMVVETEEETKEETVEEAPVKVYNIKDDEFTTIDENVLKMIEEPVKEVKKKILPKNEAKFQKISNKLAILLIDRIGDQKEFVLANIIIFHADKGLSCNNRLNKSMKEKHGKYIRLEQRYDEVEYALIEAEAFELYKRGRIYNFESFEEVKSFLKERRQHVKA